MCGVWWRAYTTLFRLHFQTMNDCWKQNIGMLNEVECTKVEEREWEKLCVVYRMESVATCHHANGVHTNALTHTHTPITFETTKNNKIVETHPTCAQESPKQVFDAVWTYVLLYMFFCTAGVFIRCLYVYTDGVHWLGCCCVRPGWRTGNIDSRKKNEISYLSNSGRNK